MSRGPRSVTSHTEVHEALQQVRVHQYWIELHNKKRTEAVIAAVTAGATLNKVAYILGVSDDTLIRHGVLPHADPDGVKLNLVKGTSGKGLYD